MANFHQRPFEFPPSDPLSVSPAQSQPNGSRETLQSQHQLNTAPRDSDDSKRSRNWSFPNIVGRKNSGGKATKTGDAPKKRGPKPDSKPALNRRQELNRQAQRTHRERKEHYTKQLEQYALETHEKFVAVTQERNAVLHENSMLKQLLAVNNIPYHASPSIIDLLPQTNDAGVPAHNYGANINSSHFNASSSNNIPGMPSISPAPTTMSLNNPPSRNESLSTVQTPAYSPAESSTQAYMGPNGNSYVAIGAAPGYSPVDAATQPLMMPAINGFSQTSPSADMSLTLSTGAYNDSALHRHARQIENQMGTSRELYAQNGTNGGYQSTTAIYGTPGLDHDTIGIEFVLALEDSCRDHATMMMQRVVDPTTSELSGHALMMTCPPHSAIMNSLGQEGVHFLNQMPNLPKADLNSMMQASSNLTLNGEVTPVMALKIIRDDYRFPFMGQKDWDQLRDSLKSRSRCYGFGAVLEEFEVRDAIDTVMQGRYPNFNAGLYQ